MDFLQTLDILGLLQGIIFSTIFLFRGFNFKIRYHVYIGFHLLTYSIEIMGTLLTDYTKAFPSMIGLPVNFYFLSPVLLYLYGRILVDPDYKVNRKIFIPALIEFCVLTVIFLFPAQRKSQWSNMWFAKIADDVYVFTTALFTCYYYLRLFRFLLISKMNFSKMQLNLNWLIAACYCIIAVLITWIALNLIPDGPDDFSFLFCLISLTFFNNGYIYFVSISGITQQPVIPAPLPRIKAKIIADPELVQLFDRMISIMNEQRLYCDPSLSLSQLAAVLQVHPKLLSKVINQCAGENFFQFINRKRVEEAKRMLLSDEFHHLSILGIGLEAGFNSKSSFNAVFKKLTGITPSEFQKNHHSSVRDGNSMADSKEAIENDLQT